MKHFPFAERRQKTFVFFSAIFKSVSRQRLLSDPCLLLVCLRVLGQMKRSTTFHIIAPIASTVSKKIQDVTTWMITWKPGLMLRELKFFTPPGRDTNPSQVSSQQTLVLLFLNLVKMKNGVSFGGK